MLHREKSGNPVPKSGRTKARQKKSSHTLSWPIYARQVIRSIINYERDFDLQWLRKKFRFFKGRARTVIDIQ
jgi:hypothetical protein